MLAALKGEDLVVYGDGKQTRTFCYVSDIVDGIVMFLCNTCLGSHLPMNLGSPDEMMVEDFAKEVIDITGSKSRIVKMAHYRPPGDAEKRRPTIDRAVDMLGWSPKVGLREGLAKMAEDFRARLKTEDLK